VLGSKQERYASSLIYSLLALKGEKKKKKKKKIE
jgi:hypothetical protein